MKKNRRLFVESTIREFHWNADLFQWWQWSDHPWNMRYTGPDAIWLIILHLKDHFSLLDGIRHWSDDWTRMHSSRMRTARLLTVSRSTPWGWGCSASRSVLHPEGVCTQGRSASRRVCIQVRWAEIPSYVICDACSEDNPPPPVDRQTPVKTLPYPKLRLRVIKNWVNNRRYATISWQC